VVFHFFFFLVLGKMSDLLESEVILRSFLLVHFFLFGRMEVSYLDRKYELPLILRGFLSGKKFPRFFFSFCADKKVGLISFIFLGVLTKSDKGSMGLQLVIMDGTSWYNNSSEFFPRISFSFSGDIILYSFFLRMEDNGGFLGVFLEEFTGGGDIGNFFIISGFIVVTLGK